MVIKAYILIYTILFNILKRLKKKGIEGKVFVRIVVLKTGEIDDEAVEVLKSPNSLLDAEAIRIMRDCPDWFPGENSKGEKAAQRIILPITFKLPSEPKKKSIRKKQRKSHEILFNSMGGIFINCL